MGGLYDPFDDRLQPVTEDTDSSGEVSVLTSWRCPACLAENTPGTEHCEPCRCPLVFAERYVVSGPLASKGSARTLAGVDRQAGTAVVIKTLSISGLGDWKLLELFQRGITVLRGLEHPGIPRHLADGELSRGGETIYFWVQQRIEGRNLNAGLDAGQRWTEARGRALAGAILDVLEYLQGFSPPILHRDIKPSNIIETPQGQWVLIDFDLVKDTLEPEGGSTVALGTAGYAPLEQLMGRAVPASDLYGLGATLVALLSRKSPADLLDPDGRLNFSGHVRVSAGLRDFMTRMLEPRVDRRPADAAAARVLLHRSSAGPATSERAARRELLDALVARTHALSSAGAASRALATPDISLRASTPAGNALVRIDTRLIEEHPPPWWLVLSRLVIIGAAGVFLPAEGVVLAGLLATLWIVSGFVVRFPVQLEPGRALFRGGFSNASEPGRYWLRRRWSETAHSIPLDVLRLDWSPAPTRVEGAEHDVWLELSLVAWIRPRSDEAGQFTALLAYRGWNEHPSLCARRLREELIDAVVEYIEGARLVPRAQGQTRSLGEDALPAIDEGLYALGLERVALDHLRVQLVPRTEDLTSEDRVRIARAPPP